VSFSGSFINDIAFKKLYLQMHTDKRCIGSFVNTFHKISLACSHCFSVFQRLLHYFIDCVNMVFLDSSSVILLIHFSDCVFHYFFFC